MTMIFFSRGGAGAGTECSLLTGKGETHTDKTDLPLFFARGTRGAFASDGKRKAALSVCFRFFQSTNRHSFRSLALSTPAIAILALSGCSKSEGAATPKENV